MQNSGIKEVQYELPEMQSGARTVANAWARVPRELSRQEKQEYREKIKKHGRDRFLYERKSQKYAARCKKR